MINDDQSLNFGELIDPIRDRFDKAWQATLRGESSAPRIEDYLAECSTNEEAKKKLLPNLIEVDRDYRQRCGESPLDYGFLQRSSHVETTFLENNSSDQASPPASPSSTFGKYTLETELGRGGFGSVHRAFDRDQQRHVALKCLLPKWSNDSKLRDSFRRESQHIAKLSHSHIVPLVEVGELENTLYIAYDLIDGENLANWLKRNRPAPSQAVKLLLPVVDAVSVAHRTDLVHRDLKPANILIDKLGKTYVTDFGLAATDQEMISGTPGLQGTIKYMAPEQLWNRGHQVGERTDVFALGVILYEMLTGRHPWPIEGLRSLEIESYRRLVDDRPPKSPRTHNPEVSESLATVCLKALAVHPRERHMDCVELVGDLRRAIGLPSFELEFPDAALQEKLAEIPPGPGLDAYRILGPDFYGQVARLIPNYEDAVATVRCAGELIRRINPRKTIVEDSHLPSAKETISQVWSGIMDAICLQGPQLLAALLLVLPTKRMPSEVLEKRNSLLETLRHPQNDEDI